MEVIVAGKICYLFFLLKKYVLSWADEVSTAFGWMTKPTRTPSFGVRGVLWSMTQENTNAHLLLTWAGVWSTSHKAKESPWELGARLDFHCLVGTPGPLPQEVEDGVKKAPGSLGSGWLFLRWGFRPSYSSLSLWPWAAHVTSLSLSFSISRMGLKPSYIMVSLWNCIGYCVIFRPSGNVRVLVGPNLLKLSRFNKAAS